MKFTALIADLQICYAYWRNIYTSNFDMLYAGFACPPNWLSIKVGAVTASVYIVENVFRTDVYPAQKVLVTCQFKVLNATAR